MWLIISIYCLKASAKVRTFFLPLGRLSLSSFAYLGLSVKTLAMKRSLGTGPKFIRQGRIFYYKDDLDEWIRNCPKVTSTAMCNCLTN